MKKIFLVAGGTGGHVFSAIALYEMLITCGYKMEFITDERGAKYFSNNHKLHILSLKYNASDKFNKIKLLFRIVFCVFKNIGLFYNRSPVLVIGFGGYQTIPTLLTAILMNVQIILYEPNSILGKTNKIFQYYAKKLVVSYPRLLQRQNTILVGPLVRDNIRKIKRDGSINNIFRLFIFGGSQGAKIFSQVIPQAIELLLPSLSPTIHLVVIQQVSKEDKSSVAQIYSKLNISYKLAEFFPNIEEIYERSDLVIARSGASTIAELSYIGLPAILIPYPYAVDNHQFYNAKSMEELKIAICINQNELTSTILADKLLYFINNPTILEDMSNNLIKLKNDDTQIFTDTVSKIIK